MKKYLALVSALLVASVTFAPLTKLYALGEEPKAVVVSPEDRRSMVAAEIMGSIYRGLLRRMELDKFRVFEKEYGLNKLEKVSRIAAQLLKLF